MKIAHIALVYYLLLIQPKFILIILADEYLMFKIPERNFLSMPSIILPEGVITARPARKDKLVLLAGAIRYTVHLNLMQQCS